MLKPVLGISQVPSISEVYSVPRVAAQAMTVGMRRGFSMDIGTINPKTGASWKLEEESEFKYLKIWRDEGKPFLLCGSPPCNAFSKIQLWNRNRQDLKRHKDMMRVGRLHLQRSYELNRVQVADGLYFLHEYPKGSSSVHEPCLESLLKTSQSLCRERPDVLLGHDGLGRAGRRARQEGDMVGHQLSMHCEGVGQRVHECEQASSALASSRAPQ